MFGQIKAIFTGPPPQPKKSTDFMPWSKEYKLGIRSVDNDHRELFNLVNEFERAVRGNLPQSTVEATMKALEAYVLEHFRREEKYLAAAKYPDLAVHRQHHTDLRLDFKAFQLDYTASPEDFDAQEFLNFLKEWLTDHILSEDMAYVPYVRGER